MRVVKTAAPEMCAPGSSCLGRSCNYLIIIEGLLLLFLLLAAAARGTRGECSGIELSPPPCS